MYHDRRKSSVTGLYPSDPGVVERAWARERLLRVRELVRGALELIEASALTPDAAAELRLALVRIDAELAERVGKSRD